MARRSYFSKRVEDHGRKSTEGRVKDKQREAALNAAIPVLRVLIVERKATEKRLKIERREAALNDPTLRELDYRVWKSNSVQKRTRHSNASLPKPEKRFPIRFRQEVSGNHF